MKSAVKRKSRSAPRKQVEPLHVSYLTSVDDFSRIAKNCCIVEASATGLLLEVLRTDLIPQTLRKTLDLNCLIGDRVFMRLDEMNLELSGTIARTQLNGKKGFLIAVDYSDEAPEYWRECLMDLLPKPGELEK